MSTGHTDGVDAETALGLATAVHAGFQSVVTVVVYPALVEVPDDRWEVAHARHSSRITCLVAPLYVIGAAVAVWAVVAGPTAAGWVAIAGNAAAAGVTAAVAGPTHGRLGQRRSEDDLRRLLVADRFRFVATLAALAAVTVGGL